MSQTENGPAPSPKGTGPENLTAAKRLSLVEQDSARRPESTGEQLRRRRAASLRCEPMVDGRRDPLEPRDVARPVSVTELDASARAQAYLRSVGLTGLPAERIRCAWAAHPDRYGSVLPRWPAA